MADEAIKAVDLEEVRTTLASQGQPWVSGMADHREIVVLRVPIGGRMAGASKTAEVATASRRGSPGACRPLPCVEVGELFGARATSQKGGLP